MKRFFPFLARLVLYSMFHGQYLQNAMRNSCLVRLVCFPSLEIHMLYRFLAFLPCFWYYILVNIYLGIMIINKFRTYPKQGVVKYENSFFCIDFPSSNFCSFCATSSNSSTHTGSFGENPAATIRPKYCCYLRNLAA